MLIPKNTTNPVRFSSLPCLLPVDGIEWIEKIGDAPAPGISVLHMLSGNQIVVGLPPEDIEALIRKSYPGWKLKTVEIGDVYEVSYVSGNKLVFKVEEIRNRVAYAVDCFVPIRDLIRGYSDQHATFQLVSRKTVEG